jgi:branched-chain amino acid transport system substrate-binding protein
VRLASLSYDAVTLALSLAANPAGQRFTPEKLTRSSGFAGVDGLFRLRPDGTCERGLAILEVTKLGPHVIDPAPSAFTVAQF